MVASLAFRLGWIAAVFLGQRYGWAFGASEDANVDRPEFTAVIVKQNIKINRHGRRMVHDCLFFVLLNNTEETREG